jgi:hypothetical protein
MDPGDNETVNIKCTQGEFCCYCLCPYFTSVNIAYYTGCEVGQRGAALPSGGDAV